MTMWKKLRSRKRTEPATEPVRQERPRSAGPAKTLETPGAGAPAGTPAAPEDQAARPGGEARPEGDVEFAVRHHTGAVHADVAPEQDEDDLPPRRSDLVPLSRADRVGDALDRWSQQIAGTTRATSFLTHMREGDHVLDLTHSHPSGLAQLLAGRGPTRLSSLVREVGALADARAHARAIRETAQRQAEEVGLTTCHLGIGEATWIPEDGGRPLQAPVLVRPITLRLRGNAREDVDLDLDATVDLNPVLLRALREAGVAVDARALLGTTDGAYGFDPNPVLDAFRALGQPLPGFRVSHALVVGNLMDAAGPLADDLAADRPEWIDHDLVAALAGDPDARRKLAEAGSTPQPVPEHELVAAVDPDRHEALEHVLGGAHLALTTPPGAEVLDLVVDLAAELNARGRSVLVVSQRRRHLSQLKADAGSRGLGDLLFDLSPDPALQRNASAALLQSLRGAGSVHRPIDAEEPPELVQARETLTGHVEAMHRVQEPWGVSAHDALSALAALTRLRPAPRTAVRLDAEVASRMVGEQRQAFADSLREAAAVGLLSTGPEDTAWFGASISSSTQSERALALVTRLREDLVPALRRAIAATGSQIGLQDARTLKDLVARIRLLGQVREVLAMFHVDVFDAQLEDMVAATGTKPWRQEHGIELRWRTRRALRRRAVSLQRPASLAPDLHTALRDIQVVRDRWRRAAADPAAVPSVPKTLPAAENLAGTLQSVVDELDVLLEGTPEGADLAATDVDVLAERLERLHADREDLEPLPRRTTLERRLRFDGLGDLVEDLRERRVGADAVAAELDLAWWRSVLELIAGAEPTISQYDGTSLSQVADRFRRLDVEHLAGSSSRVRAASDDVLVETMKAFPDTSRAAIAELARSATVSVRDLAAKYEDILFRARPTWLASPYLVPQIVPRGRHFDVVIIADGGRLPTAAALSAIARAEQTVVVGDPLEYSGQSAPVILDDMLAVATHRPLRRDARPATEGLRAFAQRRSPVPGILAAPSPFGIEPDRLIVVEGGTGPVTAGMEYVESTEAELRRVTDLVIEHARTRPERSLAVLTLTAEHARRVMERVMHTVAVVPDLRAFFDAGAREYFTVLPAAQATGVVRDDVIVSIGFGKTPHGRLLHRFGPLSEPAGRKALASVITRARGRTTVVSSITPEDLDPSRLRTDGARDLRSLLRVLAGLPDDLVLPETGAEAPVGVVSVDAAAAAEQPAPAETDEDPAADASQELTEEELDAQIEAALAADAADAEPTDPAPGPDAATDGDADPAAAAAADGTEQAEAPAEAAAREGDDAAADAAAADGADAEPEPGEDPQPDPAAEPAQAGALPTEAGSAPTARALETDALLGDLADRLWRLGLHVEADFGLTEDRIELALGHPELPGRFLVAVDTDGETYVGTRSQRERDRLRAERLEALGWATERVWSWALFIDPDGEAERIRRAVDRALAQLRADGERSASEGAATIRHRLPRPQIPAGHPLSFYASEDLDQVVEYICSDGRARLEEQLAAEVRGFLGFEQRSVLLDVSVSSAIRRFQERQ
ncbi:hypothetical protein BF93_14045 [Brachybacterium phenoliresistens]|uniref:Restriction endonuclease type II-like domain-containing protein n=2 Tax=Brachybacterium phenoliresistens TaxID=396014 RepID=Z9JUA3_9MICO|nr:hypothetical protein BF93_14045 [Brachybacterium phenoliresistens]